MALATVDESGLPDVRMVLLKGFGPDGFVFYTNLESRKGRQLAADARRRRSASTGSRSAGRCACAAMWSPSRRRRPTPISPPARGSRRIGAWASKQSEPLESRLALEKAVALTTARFAVGEVPRPPHWSGFRIVPVEIEFWRDGAFRLHDRVRFTRAGDGWTKAMLYP